MKITIYECSNPYIQSKRNQILAIAREAFDDVPENAIDNRLQKYSEIALAEDKEGIGGFVFPTTHSCGRSRMIGLRFLTVGNRCRNRKLTTLLTGVVLVRAYRLYLMERLLPGGPKSLYVIARICNPKAYYTLTKGNLGVSPNLGSSNPAAGVQKRQELYSWMKNELGLSNFDPQTGIVLDGAIGAGIVPRNVTVNDKDQADWNKYVPTGSEIMVLMNLDWKYLLNNVLRVLRIFKPVRLRKY